MSNLEQAFKTIEQFSTSSNLTERIGEIEHHFTQKSKNEISNFLLNQGINQSTISAALDIKKVAGQINVIIHAIGILLSLPFILKSGEIIESLSLGAGNTGKGFDLETNYRVAEFKFINWRGGSEAIRQNSLFKDFFNLAEFSTNKKRYLYVLKKQYPLKFLNNNRALNSVLSKDQTTRNRF